MRHRDGCTEFVAQQAGDKAVIDTLPKEANEAIIGAYKTGSTDSVGWTPFVAGTIFPVFLMPSVSSALIASLMMANSLPDHRIRIPNLSRNIPGGRLEGPERCIMELFKLLQDSVPGGIDLGYGIPKALDFFCNTPLEGASWRAVRPAHNISFPKRAVYNFKFKSISFSFLWLMVFFLRNPFTNSWLHKKLSRPMPEEIWGIQGRMLKDGVGTQEKWI